jgi:ABC-type sugar transport system substrate-binding protein
MNASDDGPSKTAGRRHLVRFVIVALAASTGSIGCKPPKDAGPPPVATLHIVAIAEAQDDPTWTALNAAKVRVLQQAGAYCSIVVEARQTASPRDQQLLLEEVQAGKVDAVCIAPTDSEAIRPAVDTLAQKGVPIVTLGRDIPGAARVLHCGPSDLEIGRAAARACADVAKVGAGSIILLHAGLNDPVYGQRYAGFTQDLPMYPELKLLREVDCAQNRGETLQMVRAESRKYPRAGCWVLLDDWPLRALAENERLVPTDCRVVVCNADPRYFPRLRNGQISALVGYDYEETAYSALVAALNLAREPQGKVTSPEVPINIITARNLAEFDKHGPTSSRAIDR